MVCSAEKSALSNGIKTKPSICLVISQTRLILVSSHMQRALFLFCSIGETRRNSFSCAWTLGSAFSLWMDPWRVNHFLEKHVRSKNGQSFKRKKVDFWRQILEDRVRWLNRVVTWVKRLADSTKEVFHEIWLHFVFSGLYGAPLAMRKKQFLLKIAILRSVRI